MRDVPDTAGDSRRDPSLPPDTPAHDREIDRDLGALAARSRGNVPPLGRTLSALAGARPARDREEGFMSLITSWTRRPRLAVLAGVAALAAGFLLVPFSYQKTVGHQVSVTLNGVGADQAWVRGFAGQLKAALGADAVRAEMRVENGAPSTVLSAEVRGDAPGFARGVADNLVHKLDAKGVSARAAVTPIREKVSGSLYAMALDNVIQVNIDGKSADEIESEIQSRLAEAGLDAQVSVEMNGSNQMKVEVKAEHDGDSPAAGEPVQLQLTSGGQPLGGEANEVAARVMKTRSDDGTEHLTVEVTKDGSTATATVDDPGSLSDADLAARIQQLLAAQGVDYSVSVQDGRVTVIDPAAAGSAVGPVSGTQKTTWGKLKEQHAGSN
jgi:hypothetical protein